MSYLRPLTNFTGQNLELVTEGRGTSRQWFVHGPAIISSKRNLNGRIYDRGMMTEEVSRYEAEHIRNGTAFGDLTHFSDCRCVPERAATLCQSLTRVDEDRWDARCKVLPENPQGAILRTLLEAKQPMGFSTRGLGELDSDGQVRSYHMLSIDSVQEGSIAIEFEALCESLMFKFNGSELVRVRETVERHRDRRDRNRQAVQLTESDRRNIITNFLKEISNG